MATTVKGIVFIVPNSLRGVKNVFNPEQIEGKVKTISEKTGKEYDPQTTVLVEVWAADDQCDNWSCHYKRVDGEEIKFPTYLPVDLFEGKKEGDTVTFKWGKYDIELTLNQLDYRYRSFGAFEKVLDDLIDQYKARMLEIA